jgi:flavin reductase
MSAGADDVSLSFRQAMRGLGASVTIISTRSNCVRYGMVATATMSLSMDPPSMVVAINQGASIHAPLIERGAFAVNILSNWDRSLAEGFARASGESRFAHGAWSLHTLPGDEQPLPYLANAVASVFCSVADVLSPGTHSLIVGRVEAVVQHNDKSPLLYCDGDYGSFNALPRMAKVSAA